MSWELHRHHVANKVLARHTDEFDRKQNHVSASRGESMLDLHQKLISRHSMSTPDLGQGIESPQMSRKGLPSVKKSASQSITFGNGSVPTYSMRKEPRHSASRLHGRRQSEPVAMIGRDLDDIHKLMKKAACLADETPDEGLNSLLESTLPGSKKTANSYSRLLQRRGTIGHTEGISADNSRELPSHSVMVSPNVVGLRPRRGSLPINHRDLKTVHEESKTKSAKQRKRAESNTKEKKGHVSSSPRRNVKAKSAKSFKELNGVHVSFYSEDTGEESAPVVPHLELYDADESVVADDSCDDKSVENAEGVWKDVAKCRYIRGYDPPEMIPPQEDTAKFVFGRSYNDGFQAQQDKTEAT